MARIPQRLLFSIFLMLLSTPIFAQFGGDDEEDPDYGIPIDGGVSILVASGAMYAAYKFVKKQPK